jgi:hypothetical protein
VKSIEHELVPDGDRFGCESLSLGRTLADQHGSGRVSPRAIDLPNEAVSDRLPVMCDRPQDDVGPKTTDEQDDRGNGGPLRPGNVSCPPVPRDLGVGEPTSKPRNVAQVRRAEREPWTGESRAEHV